MTHLESDTPPALAAPLTYPVKPVGLNSDALRGRECRLNPGYCLLALDDLQRDASTTVFDELRTHPDCDMVLLPREPGLTIKAVSTDVADLLKSRFVPDDLGDDIVKSLCTLILDGVLEVHTGRSFVSGPGAVSTVLPSFDLRLGVNRLSTMSYRAIRYAQALELDDPRVLSRRLYFYNRLPITPLRQYRLGASASVEAHLGLDEPTAHRESLRRNWDRIVPAVGADSWFRWHAKHSRPAARDASVYKLYISPHCDHIQDVFPTVIEYVSDSAATVFKIGNDVRGLLRPDKMIAYFSNQADLLEAAAILDSRLNGCPPHGTPFTAELSGEGLLSWGIDPPTTRRTLSWIADASWRTWLTTKLAYALTVAKSHADNTIEPWRFALVRLAAEGVDTASWVAQADVWASGTDASQMPQRRGGIAW